MSNIHPLTGQTIRVTASNLTDANGIALTAPTVEITVVDPDGDSTTPTVTEDDGTWYAEFTSEVVGKHLIRATASAGGGVWRGEAQVHVYAYG